MFGTAIHWTTFFYLLLDTIIVAITFYYSNTKPCSTLNRFLNLGVLFILYNTSGGFLPSEHFPGPIIIQYVITYSITIALCVYMVYYLYKEYDIEVLEYNSSIKNLSILAGGGFAVLFLLPYFLTDSLNSARLIFTIPISVVAIIFLVIFYRRISNPPNPTPFILRRNKLAIVSIVSIALLPISTLVGDYQWITFTVINIGFYAITTIEVERYLYIIENRARMYEIFALQNKTNGYEEYKKIYEKLTRREIEITTFILDGLTYKNIGKKLFITERTVSKHASNIFKKTGVKSKKEFLSQFSQKKKG
ncbi:helix-turn-helix domain-containing protein [Winogradskyella maritima]|uniref:Helix-turn-helix transcriptional regulator n=1 Tax=Winogradskyella maritima TaxID=1517766 RepID=A0ABV8AF42_9FLAO